MVVKRMMPSPSCYPESWELLSSIWDGSKIIEMGYNPSFVREDVLSMDVFFNSQPVHNLHISVNKENSLKFSADFIINIIVHIWES